MVVGGEGSGCDDPWITSIDETCHGNWWSWGQVEVWIGKHVPQLEPQLWSNRGWVGVELGLSWVTSWRSSWRCLNVPNTISLDTTGTYFHNSSRTWHRLGRATSSPSFSDGQLSYRLGYAHAHRRQASSWKVLSLKASSCGPSSLECRCKCNRLVWSSIFVCRTSQARKYMRYY